MRKDDTNLLLHKLFLVSYTEKMHTQHNYSVTFPEVHHYNTPLHHVTVTASAGESSIKELEEQLRKSRAENILHQRHVEHLASRMQSEAEVSCDTLWKRLTFYDCGYERIVLFTSSLSTSPSLLFSLILFLILNILLIIILLSSSSTYSTPTSSSSSSLPSSRSPSLSPSSSPSSSSSLSLSPSSKLTITHTFLSG